MRTPHDHFWTLDESTGFLNHGSFGAAPRSVQAAQTEWRRQLEAQPVRFFQRELEAELDAARTTLAAFLGTYDRDLVFVRNATTGVNAVPFPLRSAAQVVESILDALTDRTKLAMVEHVTSPTGLILPIGRIVAELRSRGIDVLANGAHAAGMVDVNIDVIGATFYAGNCHKWLYAPKGAGSLHVAAEHQGEVVPAVVSHDYNTDHDERSRFHLLFDWTGTDDPTALLSVPPAIQAMGTLHPGGWPELMAVNRSLALAARTLPCRRLGVEPPAPDNMVGAMAAIPLPDAEEPPLPYGRDALQDRLFFEHQFEILVLFWPQWPARLVRISAQAYNTLDQYERLAGVLERRLNR